MSEANAGRIFFGLFKVAAFLGVGTLIGFSLGLAYASHLYGSPPVVTQIQDWLTGGTLYEGPSPVDQTPVDQLPISQISGAEAPAPVKHLPLRKYADELMSSPVSIIPKIGACIGFGMAVSIFFGSFFLRILIETAKKRKKNS